MLAVQKSAIQKFSEELALFLNAHQVLPHFLDVRVVHLFPPTLLLHLGLNVLELSFERFKVVLD